MAVDLDYVITLSIIDSWSMYLYIFKSFKEKSWNRTVYKRNTSTYIDQIYMETLLVTKAY